MRKSTKRLVSSILALSMLITSVTVNPVNVFATDHSSNTLSGYSFESSEADGVKTSTWTFNTTDPADTKDDAGVTINGVEDPTIAAGDTLDGITVTGEGQKSWNAGNQFSVSKKMGFDIAVTDGCTGGSVAITSTGSKDTRFLLLGEKKVPYSKGTETVEFTESDIQNGVLSFSNTSSDGDFKISSIVLTENFGSSEETTEETTEATTVEETTEETTAENSTSAEETTEATTAEPVVGSDYTLVFGDAAAAAGLSTGDAFAKFKGAVIDIDSDAVEVVAAQQLAFTKKNPPEIAEFENGNVYDSWIASTSDQTAVSVDGAEPANYRVVFTIKALKDCSVAVDAKASGNDKVVVFGKTEDPVDAIANVTSLDVVETGNPGVTTLKTFTADLQEGEVVVLLGKGTNPPVFGINVDAGEEPAPSAEWRVVFEKLIADKGAGDNYVFAGQTIYEDDDITVKPCQTLTASKEEESVFEGSGNTYTRWVASSSDQASVSVDGADPANYRKVVTVDVKSDGKLFLDVKASGNDKVVVVATGNDTDGYTSVPDGVIETGNPGVTDFHTFEVEVKKGDVITLLGKGTNPPLFGINFEGENQDTDAFAILLAQNEIAEYDIEAGKTSESISFYTKNNPGFNNFTLFVKYDPSLIKATSGSWGDLLANVDGFSDNAGLIDKQIADVPKANNTDYAEVGADGVKTQAELGLIKIAGFSKDPETNYVVNGDGVLFTINFDILQQVTEKTDTGLTLIIVQDGFRPELGSEDIIDTEIYNDVYLLPAEETSESTTEETSESTTAEETSTEGTTAEETSTEATTEATTAEETTEATTAEETSTEETTVEPTTIYIVTTKRQSGGGGSHGGSSSSLTKSPTTTTEAQIEETTSSRQSNVGDGGSFTVQGKNGQDVVIMPPKATKSVNDFSDVPKSHWAYDSIMKLAELGVVNGVGDNMFAPSAPCKRADFIIMINNTLGITGTAKFNFSDVAANKYYYNPVGVAYEIGIASGYGDDTFKPENYCTREEMMVLVAKTFEFLGETVTTTSQDNLSVFADRDQISWWAAPYTAYLVEKGMVVGTGANFEPKVYMNRAQLAVLIAQVYDKVVDMAAERGVSANDVVEDLVEEASVEETDAAAAVKLANHVKADRDEIVSDYYKDLDKDVKANFDKRNEEFEELLATISEDMSEEDAAKAIVSLKEADELFEDIIAAAE